MPMISAFAESKEPRLIVAQPDRVVLEVDRTQRDREPVREHEDRRLVVLAQIAAGRIADIEHAVELAAGRERHREAGRDAGERRVPAIAHGEPRTRGDRGP